ncbi:HlyD family secretion protein [Roseateles albus]|uniref:HlyD family secretion protein n=1 Tax=Roseateles albus TaxID=2987525 RepID=A0ABT5KE73_9BURK|nr:HlyD family secretion protein [Roseateles albus]MDC8772193.1 HlyD family secretion protein [Roseateles albus]
MDALLLGIYAFFVWLIFFKFKWLPWTTTSQVIVVTIPIVALTTAIMLLNVFAPSSSDVRVIKYVINVVPQVGGRVIDVPIEPNRPVKKGDVLFRIDPTNYALTVRALEAQLANAQANSRELDEQAGGAAAGVDAARGGVKQAEARIREVQVRMELARRRVAENTELVKTGAGDRFTLEAAETDAKALDAQLDTARGVLAQSRAAEAQALASQRQIRQRIGGKVGDEFAPVAQVRAQLENARWQLAQTVVTAPADGYAINVQLRPGSFTAAFPITPALTFVENTTQVIALFHQNELHQVQPGNEAEFILPTHPGHVFKAKVDSIVWAQGQGQVGNSTQLPTTGYGPIAPGRFPVKLIVDAADAHTFLAAGAIGDGAIFTDGMAPLHILRKVLLRVSTKVNYLVLKLH